MPSFGVGGPVPLITIGLGPDPRLITSGLSTVIIKTVKALRAGRAAYKKFISEYEERFKIAAMILEANGKEIINPVSNKISRIFLENNINIKRSYPKELLWKRTKRPVIEVKDIQVSYITDENIKITAEHKKHDIKKNDIKITAKRKINV